MDVDFFYKRCEVTKPSRHPSPETTNIGNILYWHEQRWPNGTSVKFLHGKENYKIQKIDGETWAYKTEKRDWQILQAKSLQEAIEKIFKPTKNDHNTKQTKRSRSN